MRSELFYSATSENAIPLILVEEAAAESGIESYSEVARNFLKAQDFKGKVGQIAFLYDMDGKIDKVLVGIGKDNLLQGFAQAATKLPPNTYMLEQEVSDLAYLYWAFAQYKFEEFKKESIEPRVLVLPATLIQKIIPELEATFFIRDLINQPTNNLTPSHLASCMESLAQQFGALFTQWVGEDLLTSNLPAIHAVGRASFEAPRLLKLTWGDPNNPKVALIGKGVCFDSGGLNIKPAQFMRLMKKDMGGAAHVLGLAQWIMTKSLPLYLEVYIPAVENAISANAYRPGDVLTMRNGLTVEIDNTDAEGRLVLADALTLACEEKPELVIDFSTLTGAARVAVGTEIAAMFTNNETLASDLEKAALETQDPIWRLPLFSGYTGLLDSNIADMLNCGASPYAGAITAALFLQRFISNGTAWVHFDIMAWNLSNKPGKPEGGEAMGMRAVARYLLKRFANASQGA